MATAFCPVVVNTQDISGDKGIAQGRRFSVFDARIGRIGIMICFDVHMPEVARATETDTVVVAEVDLSEQYGWRANMGDFKSRLRHERPDVKLPK